MPHRSNPIPRFNVATTTTSSAASGTPTSTSTSTSSRRDPNTVPPRHRSTSWASQTNNDGQVGSTTTSKPSGRALPPPRFQRKQRPPRAQQQNANNGSPSSPPGETGSLTFGPANNWGPGTSAVRSLSMAAVNAASARGSVVHPNGTRLASLGPSHNGVRQDASFDLPPNITIREDPIVSLSVPQQRLTFGMGMSNPPNGSSFTPDMPSLSASMAMQSDHGEPDIFVPTYPLQDVGMPPPGRSDLSRHPSNSPHIPYHHIQSTTSDPSRLNSLPFPVSNGRIADLGDDPQGLNRLRGDSTASVSSLNGGRPLTPNSASKKPLKSALKQRKTNYSFTGSIESATGTLQPTATSVTPSGDLETGGRFGLSEDLDRQYMYQIMLLQDQYAWKGESKTTAASPKKVTTAPPNTAVTVVEEPVVLPPAAPEPAPLTITASNRVSFFDEVRVIEREVADSIMDDSDEEYFEAPTYPDSEEDGRSDEGDRGHGRRISLNLDDVDVTKVDSADSRDLSPLIWEGNKTAEPANTVSSADEASNKTSEKVVSSADEAASGETSSNGPTVVISPPRPASVDRPISFISEKSVESAPYANPFDSSSSTIHEDIYRNLKRASIGSHSSGTLRATQISENPDATVPSTQEPVALHTFPPSLQRLAQRVSRETTLPGPSQSPFSDIHAAPVAYSRHSLPPMEKSSITPDELRVSRSKTIGSRPRLASRSPSPTISGNGSCESNASGYGHLIATTLNKGLPGLGPTPPPSSNGHLHPTTYNRVPGPHISFGPRPPPQRNIYSPPLQVIRPPVPPPQVQNITSTAGMRNLPASLVLSESSSAGSAESGSSNGGCPPSATVPNNGISRSHVRPVNGTTFIPTSNGHGHGGQLQTFGALGTRLSAVPTPKPLEPLGLTVWDDRGSIRSVGSSGSLRPSNASAKSNNSSSGSGKAFGESIWTLGKEEVGWGSGTPSLIQSPETSLAPGPSLASPTTQINKKNSFNRSSLLGPTSYSENRTIEQEYSDSIGSPASDKPWPNRAEYGNGIGSPSNLSPAQQRHSLSPRASNPDLALHPQQPSAFMAADARPFVPRQTLQPSRSVPLLSEPADPAALAADWENHRAMRTAQVRAAAVNFAPPINTRQLARPSSSRSLAFANIITPTKTNFSPIQETPLDPMPRAAPRPDAFGRTGVIALPASGGVFPRIQAVPIAHTEDGMRSGGSGAQFKSLFKSRAAKILR